MRHLLNFEKFVPVVEIIFEDTSYLSEDENKSIKLIYKFIRDILLDFKYQISVYYQKNPGTVSISDFIKNRYNTYKNVKISSEVNTLILDFDLIDPLIKKTFKSLQNEFFIRFIVKSEGAAIKSKTEPLRINGLEMGTTKLLNFPEDAL